MKSERVLTMGRLVKSFIIPFYLFTIGLLAIWQERLALLQHLQSDQKVGNMREEDGDGLRLGEILGREKGLVLPEFLPNGTLCKGSY